MSASVGLRYGVRTGYKVITLAIPEVGTDEPLPSEFRLFRAGMNDTSKGPTLFDGAAAKSVMAAYAQWGVDLMIDVDHASLDPVASASRRDAGDAVGWFGLEVRGGELWAAGVRWNAEGERQLRGKLRRYISPAFYQDEDGRVTEMINIALVAMPATYGAQALVAASRGTVRRLSMDPKQIAAAIEAIKNQDSDAALVILEELLISAAGGETPEEPEENPSDETAEPPPAEPPMAAGNELASKLSALLGVEGDAEIELAVAELKASVEARAAEVARQELTIRKALVGELVKLGAETPATAWAGEELAPRLVAEPLDSLRSRVVALRKSTPKAVEAPKSAPLSGVSERDQQALSRLTPAQQEVYKRIRGLAGKA